MRQGSADLEVYLGAGVRVRRRGRAQDVERLSAAWADLDSPEAVDRLRDFQPPPSLLVATSPSRFQAWWQLSPSIDAGSGERLNRQLAQALAADRAAVDAARVLRPIASLNHKTRPPTRVACVAVELAAFRLHDFDHLPDVAEPTTSTGLPSRRVTTGGDLDVLRTIPSAEFVPLLTGRDVNGQGFVRCPFHAGGQERTPSLHVDEDSAQWYCHGCRTGGGYLEFYALLTDRDLPASGREFAALVREVADAIVGRAAA